MEMNPVDVALPGVDHRFPDLLAALHLEGIAVGHEELVRLQHIFHLQPATLDRQGLKSLLACTLVKHEAHRDRFEALFEAWCPADEMEAEQAPEVIEPTEPTPWVAPLRPATPEPSAPTPPPAAETSSPAPGRRPWWRWGLALLLLSVLIALAALLTKRSPAPIPLPPPRAAANSQTAPPAATEWPTDPASQFWTWRPTVTVAPPTVLSSPWALLRLSILSLLGIVFLLRRWQAGLDRVIPPAEASPEVGPAWLPLPDLKASGSALLAPDALRAAVWGVERFVSEDKTDRIDLEETVAATAAAGGLPTLRFAHAAYAGEVWIWRDTMAQDATLTHMIAELTSSLTRAGLPVRTGTFADLPEIISWEEGQVWSPLALEGHRQSAIVLILTDGIGMQLAAGDDLTRGTLSQLLHGLSEWPRLAFVDLSEGANGLPALLQRYGVACTTLEAMPAFLGAGSMQAVAKQQSHSQLLGDLRVWAAAAALSSEPVDTETALDLRERLRLSVSPLALRSLLSAAGRSGATLTWPPKMRAELLNWLIQCSMGKTNNMATGSPLALALDYWTERYQQADDARTAVQTRLDQTAQPNPLLPWRQTQAQRRTRMEIALWRLWGEPVEAANTLYKLRDDPEVKDEIEERLGGMAAWDQRQTARSGQVCLPWRFADLPASVRLMLSKLNFGGMDEGRLKMPLRLALTLGVCGGIAGVALVTALWRLFVPMPPAFTPKLPEALQAVMIREYERSGPSTYQVTVGTPRQLVVKKGVPAGGAVDIGWAWAPVPNVEKLGESELWRAGTLPQPIRACEKGWPRRSLFVIAMPPDHTPARQLAIQLLDRGSADAVLLGTDWRAHTDRLFAVDASMTRADQLVVIARPDADVPAVDFQGAYGEVRSGDLRDLITRLALLEKQTIIQDKIILVVDKTKESGRINVYIEGDKHIYTINSRDDTKSLHRLISTKHGNYIVERRGGKVSIKREGTQESQANTHALQDVWSDVKARGKPLIRSGSQETLLQDTSLTFVTLCGGTFTMGSAELDWEKPPHPVTLNSFDITQTEITNQQYRQFRKDHPENDDLPVVNVTWQEARDYCDSHDDKDYDYGLPTEAEWEYAARGGSVTRWSFGDDEAQVDKYAWWSRNSDARAHSVKTRLPNPLGLYDMHGNVLEWVEDCFDERAYHDRSPLIADPLVKSLRCQFRAQRGGCAWDGDLRRLRSAGRDWDRPGVRGDIGGFRCVRRARRQP